MADKIKLSHKKFYDKWIYKVSLRVPGISIIRTTSTEEIKNLCKSNVFKTYGYVSYQKCWENRDNILPLIDFLETYDSKNYFKRIESSILDLYTNDKNFYDSIYDKFKDIVIFRSEPKYLDINEDSSPDTILVKKFPHNRYQYKVFLLPHKMGGDKQAKTNFINWMKNQSPRVTCTDAVERWFINTNWNWDRRYILVEDESTLLMLKLRCSEAVGRIYNYKISDK